ncbi:MAG TPA: 30S ribosomal protein S4 [Candidatus Gracilibacteria bacterium]
MRYTGPRARLSRREGVNLFGSAKHANIMARKPAIPGMHGAKRQGKLSEYARQLREKQKMKRMYELSEKQFRNYFDKASRAKAVTGDALFELLERRLDNVIYRSGLAVTRAQARQLVTHGIFNLNGRRINVPSAMVREGDVIEVRESKKGLVIFKENKEFLKDYNAPSWLSVDLSKLRTEIQSLPDARHFDAIIETRLIVEFYSR